MRIINVAAAQNGPIHQRADSREVSSSASRSNDEAMPAEQDLNRLSPVARTHHFFSARYNKIQPRSYLV